MWEQFHKKRLMKLLHLPGANELSYMQYIPCEITWVDAGFFFLIAKCSKTSADEWFFWRWIHCIIIFSDASTMKYYYLETYIWYESEIQYVNVGLIY